VILTPVRGVGRPGRRGEQRRPRPPTLRPSWPGNLVGPLAAILITKLLKRERYVEASLSSDRSSSIRARTFGESQEPSLPAASVSSANFRNPSIDSPTNSLTKSRIVRRNAFSFCNSLSNCALRASRNRSTAMRSSLRSSTTWDVRCSPVQGVRPIFNLVHHAFPSPRLISPASSRLAGLALFRNRLGWRTREVRG
jgi:hypothetical protein